MVEDGRNNILKGKLFNFLLILIFSVFLSGGSCNIFGGGNEEEGEKSTNPITDPIASPIDDPNLFDVANQLADPNHISGAGSNGEVGTIGGL